MRLLCEFGIWLSFVRQVGLCLDDQTLKQALRLFKESKSLLIANIDSIGTGTVRRSIFSENLRDLPSSMIWLVWYRMVNV